MDSLAGRTYWWKGILITKAVCLLVSRKEKEGKTQANAKREREA
jgi:hypothetical protein